MWEWMLPPLKPSSVTQRSSSSAASPGAGDRQAREADEPRRVLRDERRQRVVRLARVLDLDVRLELLEARARDAEELDRDARPVHRVDPRLAQVEERVPQLVAVREDDVRQRRLEPHPHVLLVDSNSGGRRAAVEEAT